MAVFTIAAKSIFSSVGYYVWEVKLHPSPPHPEKPKNRVIFGKTILKINKGWREKLISLLFNRYAH